MNSPAPDVSQATINPAHGTIAITLGAVDAGTELPIHHQLAPWPTDGLVETIATEALAGMGWTVVGGGSFTGDVRDPNATFVLDVVPGGQPPPG